MPSRIAVNWKEDFEEYKCVRCGRLPAKKARICNVKHKVCLECLGTKHQDQQIKCPVGRNCYITLVSSIIYKSPLQKIKFGSFFFSLSDARLFRQWKKYVEKGAGIEVPVILPQRVERVWGAQDATVRPPWPRQKLVPVQRNNTVSTVRGRMCGVIWIYRY